MKRILMLKPGECGSGDTYKGKIYDVIEDILVVRKTITEDGEEYWDSFNYEYTPDNIQKYSEFSQSRWVTIIDESSEDCFEIFEEDDRCILCESDRELAHVLIDRIEGLDKAIVNMAMNFNLKKLK